MKNSYPIVATLSVVASGDCILLVRRRNQPDAGLWGFPGGKIRRGETIREAAQRELHEETGIEAFPHKIGTPLEIMDRDDAGTGHHFILVPVFLRYRGGIPRAGGDALEAAWIPCDRLPELESFMSLDVEEIAASAIEEMNRDIS
jgi:ADP-ribose pyrophosphatase YjhB (NUDIX family)